MISERILKLQYVALRKLEPCVFDFVKTSLNILTKLNVTSGDNDETMWWVKYKNEVSFL